MHLAKVDLTALSREVIQDLSPINYERFILKLEDGVRGLWDAEELRRALWNLAINAVKYGAPRQADHRHGEAVWLGSANIGAQLRIGDSAGRSGCHIGFIHIDSYFDELADVREILDRRYDDFKSGRLKELTAEEPRHEP